jgi:hypothetical protein
MENPSPSLVIAPTANRAFALAILSIIGYSQHRMIENDDYIDP